MNGSDSPTYFDRPVIKEPVWKWYVPAYFVTGGVAGAASMIGAVADLLDHNEFDALIVRCRWLAATSAVASTGLLVADLGKRAKFLYMLRVFRPTSPMSVGSFIFAPFSGLASASVAFQHFIGPASGPARAAGWLTGMLGAPMTGYTAVLTANTAVPIWQETRRSLPPLYVSSALAGASGALSIMNTSESSAIVLENLRRAAAVADLAAGFALEHEAKRIERVGRPLKEGVSGTLWKISKGCAAAGLVLSFVPRRGRKLRTLGGMLSIASSATAKLAIFRAGIASARDPRATFDQQRARLETATIPHS